MRGIVAVCFTLLVISSTLASDIVLETNKRSTDCNAEILNAQHLYTCHSQWSVNKVDPEATIDVYVCEYAKAWITAITAAVNNGCWSLPDNCVINQTELSKIFNEEAPEDTPRALMAAIN